MAEGFGRALLKGKAEVYSAGVEPHGMNERAMRVMAEAGVPLVGHSSKHVRELVEAGVVFDYVVTVCGHADEACPVLPGRGGGARRIHRGFDDPPRLAKEAKSEEEALGHYRRVRDEIRAFVEGLDARVLEEMAGRGK
jgi:arsenate reductase